MRIFAIFSMAAPNELDSLSPTFTALGLRDEQTVIAFLDRLRSSERTLIYDVIARKRKACNQIKTVHIFKTLFAGAQQYEAPKIPAQLPISYAEVQAVWWTNFVPYFLYGTSDMLTMLITGESFDR